MVPLKDPFRHEPRLRWPLILIRALLSAVSRPGGFGCLKNIVEVHHGVIEPEGEQRGGLAEPGAGADWTEAREAELDRIRRQLRRSHHPELAQEIAPVLLRRRRGKSVFRRELRVAQPAADQRQHPLLPRRMGF